MTTSVVMATQNWDPSLSGLLASLERSQAKLSSSEEEYGFLNGMLRSRELHALFQVHNKILEKEKCDYFHPVLSNAMQIIIEVLDTLLPKLPFQNDIKELFFVLQSPHLQGLLYAHDAIAQKDFYPRLPEITSDADEDEETIKIVQLVKSNEPLGATIRSDEETGRIVIARIMHGGAADRSGLIHVGDEVIEVNGIGVEGKTPNDVLKILQSSEGTITFKLIPSDGKLGKRESRVRVRAHFDYDAKKDGHIPCKEAGLSFCKGDVLHIVSQEDQYWWQARKEGDRNLRAGLIPSKLLQERRIMLERVEMKGRDLQYDDDNDSVNNDCINVVPSTCLHASLNNADNSPLALCAAPAINLKDDTITTTSTCIPTKSKTKKVIYDTAESDDFDREEIPTYEEVVKMYPRPGLYRPLVLIGPPGIGRNELKRRLIALSPEKFRTPTPYTSRAPKVGEVNGKEYYFVSRERLLQDINGGKFIEHGEYKGNIYGTSAETVKALMQAGFICILTPHYQALKMLRTPQVKPYVVYIKPPPFDLFKETRNAAFAKSTFDESNSRGFTDDEFHEILRSAARIEFLYSHWFDETIVNADLSDSFEQLLSAVHKIETEPLWVPASWVQ